MKRQEKTKENTNRKDYFIDTTRFHEKNKYRTNIFTYLTVQLIQQITN